MQPPWQSSRQSGDKRGGGNKSGHGRHHQATLRGSVGNAANMEIGKKALVTAAWGLPITDHRGDYQTSLHSAEDASCWHFWKMTIGCHTQCRIFGITAKGGCHCRDITKTFPGCLFKRSVNVTAQDLWLPFMKSPLSIQHKLGALLVQCKNGGSSFALCRSFSAIVLILQKPHRRRYSHYLLLE